MHSGAETATIAREIVQLIVTASNGKQSVGAAVAAAADTSNGEAFGRTVAGIDAAERLALAMLERCRELHRQLCASSVFKGMRLAALLGVPHPVELVCGSAGALLVDLPGGDRDAFGKFVASIVLRGLVVDRRQSNVPGQGVGDGGDGVLELAGAESSDGGGGAGVQGAGPLQSMRVEVRTVMPDRASGKWRPHLPHSAATDLLYILVLFRVHELPRSACTLADTLRRTVGWVVVIDNADSFAGMRPWRGKGPTLNPPKWLTMPHDAPAFTTRPDGQTCVHRPPTLLCEELPRLVAPAERTDSLAYWRALERLGKRRLVRSPAAVRAAAAAATAAAAAVARPSAAAAAVAREK